MSGPLINPAALEPLFQPWEEPTKHRIRARNKTQPAEAVDGRRPSPIAIAQNIRGFVRQWRESFYIGASDTTRHLFDYWFNRSHLRTTQAGEDFEFRYYFCQREALETLVFLKEVRGFNALSQIVSEFGGSTRDVDALGITEAEDAWGRYGFKLATGAGKTKVMSLAMVWSYFHALRESDSELARHFVLIAPNLTVYERLRQDFRPADGGPDIFDSDPLIPPEWRGDWNLSVVLQDEVAGATTGGTLYLTNIHRLYDPTKRTRKDAEMFDWIGPPVSKAKALDSSDALRERITQHPRVMVLNDEAHHVWDPDSAWNEAIDFLHHTIRQRGGDGLAAQLDFSATPKDNKGQLFKHIVCDTPLGEAVDAGIVKTPLIGQADQKLEENPDDNAAYRYEKHLRLGYERWKASRDEWQKSGKKALLFIMCEDTKAADEIAARFNNDEVFKDLNGKTINLHTNLKGRVKKVGKGAAVRYEFVEDEAKIDDEDLRVLRTLSRELDSNSSPYSCIVSVLMLREGWDVRNVTTVVPLRPYSSKAGILPEQTLGRGLRRMTPPGQAHEIVTVVEHPSFAALYEQELSQEGLPIEIVDIDRVPATTVSIFPDPRKDTQALDIVMPRLSAGHRQTGLQGLTTADVKKEFAKYQALPLGSAKDRTEIQYEGRHLFTGEIVEQLTISLPLLATGIGAVSYYVKQLESICRIKGTHAVLAPLLQTFLEEQLFERKVTLFEPSVVARLGDSDVQEHIRAVFVPLIRQRTVTTETRAADTEPIRLSTWRPFQVTHSERSPVTEAKRTLFNLVTCRMGLELAMSEFLDRAPDVAAFAKNAGPQSLRIDYLAPGGRLSFYTPDFFARGTDNSYFLIETKGREDKDVPRKARAAISWCEAASAHGQKWQYVYVPQGVFGRLAGDSLVDLIRTCRPALQTLLEEQEAPTLPLLAAIAEATTKDNETAPEIKGIVDEQILVALPTRYRKAVEQATMLFRFLEHKEGMNFAPVFNALLGSMDEAAKGLMRRRLEPSVPKAVDDQKVWFDPYLHDVEPRMRDHYRNTAQNLKRTLVFKNGLSPLGLLRTCMDYALNDNTKLGGVFEAVRTAFRFTGSRDLFSKVAKINEFRNTYVAHQQVELSDVKKAEVSLKEWIHGLRALSDAK